MSTKPKDKIFGLNLTAKARNACEYSKTDLPLDHPNGICTFIAVIEDGITGIADRIADWALGDSDPELDTFARTLRSGG